MWLMLVPIFLCAIAIYHDLRTREIPDAVSGVSFASGMIVTGMGNHTVSLGDAMLASMASFLLLLVIAMVTELGGGDVKLVAGLSAWLGLKLTLSFWLWTALAGAVFSFVALAREQKDLAYAPAIGVGFLITILLPNAMHEIIRLIQSFIFG